MTGARATDEVTEDREETKEVDGIVTAASETTTMLAGWPASPPALTQPAAGTLPPPPILPTPLTPSLPFSTPFVSNWDESITALTAN